MTRMTILSATACLAAASATPAQAQDAPGPRPDPATRVVSYADLNPVEPVDAAALDERLRAAARRVCNDVHRSSAMTHYSVVHMCRRAALEDARRDVATSLASADGPDDRSVTLRAAASTRASED